MTTAPSGPRACWCGHPELAPYSADYQVCRACGTLVSRAPVPASPSALYDETYWFERQTGHHGLPDLRERARLDLPERCTHWLQHLVTRRLPPARVLELGCGHGGYLALLGWAGYTAVGTEMSPVVAGLARELFAVDVRAGAIETQDFAAGSFDAIVLNDVLEHLADPLATLRRCAGLLAAGGLFVVQMPEYKEHLSHADLVAANDLFLRHMDRNNDEHLYLHSRRSAAALFGRVGFPVLEFAEPVYAYDQFFTASREPLPRHAEDAVAAAISGRPQGRLALALLDKARESKDRWWAIRRLEASAGGNSATA